MTDLLNQFAPDSTVSISGALPRRLEVDVFEPWIVVPEYRPVRAPQAQWLVRDVKAATRWSARFIATILGTTHPTVAALIDGRAAGGRHLPELHAQLRELHDVVMRVHAIAGDDQEETVRLLTTARPGAEQAVDLLRSRDPAGAYLAAVDAARPPRSGGPMTGLFPARAGEATAALEDQ